MYCCVVLFCLHLRTIIPALMISARYELQAAGADPRVRDEEGRTMKARAQEWGHGRLVAWLEALDAAADPVNVNARVIAC